MECDRHHRATRLTRAQKTDGVKNPNSPIDLKEWVTNHDCHMESLTKADVATALDTATDDVREVLQLRGELAKSSVKKYEAMQHVAGRDGRGRGFLQFYGAGRTGRFVGASSKSKTYPATTFQTCPRPETSCGPEAVELLYDSIPGTLSQLIRTAFIPADGHRFVVANFSAFEARVIAWLAGEATTLEAFRDGKDLYCETASLMFGVPVDKQGVNAELRQKGKIAVLACGYQGSVGALKAMGARRIGAG